MPAPHSIEPRQTNGKHPGRPLPQPLAHPGPCNLIFPTPCGTPAPCGRPCHLKLGPERHAVVDLGNLARMAIMATPCGLGTFREQAEELFAQVLCILERHTTPLVPTTMMVFLRHSGDEAECRQIHQRCFANAMPVTTFVVQPPCGGAELGVELWALGGPDVKIERYGPELLTVEWDGIEWIHCGDIQGGAGSEGAYAESLAAFRRMESRLAGFDIGFDQVVRTWLYVNQIHGPDHESQRYQELNRARTDFFRGIKFGAKARAASAPETIYPASTGIGTSGTNIRMSCMAMNSKRPDVFLLPLENPQQTPAYDYHECYSPQSPKFSRAMAVVQGHFVSTLVSGTASIVNAKTCYPDDIVRQTEQTIENIRRLIAPDNFARHGLPGAGAQLSDIAKLRVYVKRPEDYEACRKICESSLPGAPAIYLNAEVCRPDLLMEMEAVAFSRLNSRTA